MYSLLTVIQPLTSILMLMRQVCLDTLRLFLICLIASKVGVLGGWLARDPGVDGWVENASGCGARGVDSRVEGFLRGLPVGCLAPGVSGCGTRGVDSRVKGFLADRPASCLAPIRRMNISHSNLPTLCLKCAEHISIFASSLSFSALCRC